MSTNREQFFPCIPPADIERFSKTTTGLEEVARQAAMEAQGEWDAIKPEV